MSPQSLMILLWHRFAAAANRLYTIQADHLLISNNKIVPVLVSESDARPNLCEFFAANVECTLEI